MPRILALRVSAALAVMLGGSVRASASQSLQLEELSSWSPPAEYEVSGAAIARDGSVLIWSLRHPVLVVLKDGAARSLAVDSVAIPLSAALADSGRIELFDSGLPGLVTYDLEGRFLHEHRLGIPGVVESAVAVGGTWYAATRTAPDSVVVYRASPSLPGEVVGHAPGRASVHLRAHGGDLLLTEASWPFRIQRWRGGARTWFDGDSASVERPPADSGLWTSLAAVPLDGGALRTMADLRSEARVLERFDAEGRLVRTLRVDAPIGIVATAPDLRLAVGVRRTDRTEVVLYQWRWAPGKVTPRPSTRR